jgi:2-C-methyl-D-erythritol 2,4-cyclodiphosphate synthase
MPDYRRAHVPGGTYIFTVNTYRCQSFLTDADVRSALREVIGALRSTHPFANELARTRALRSLIEALGFQVANVDATVIAQKPKLAPYFAAMRENLAADLRVDPGQVNLKGTTTEGMGFAGREEGIAAHAVALLCRVTNAE